MSDSADRPLLDLAECAAREAGALLRSRHRTGRRDVVSSVGRDIKLKSDQAAEAVILKILQSGSAIPVLTEESGAHGATDSVEAVWIVDPLDGSLNFNRGIPLVCVSIALWRQAAPCLGLVYDFVRDELFSAEVGRGAWLNGRPISVSNVTDPAAGILATGIPSAAHLNAETASCLVETMLSFKKVRMLGAAALMLAWVACGRTDAYCEDDIMLWDVAAGLALVKAAGGWIACRPGNGKWKCRVHAASASSLFPHRI